jgi:hypothetical protein
LRPQSSQFGQEVREAKDADVAGIEVADDLSYVIRMAISRSDESDAPNGPGFPILMCQVHSSVCSYHGLAGSRMTLDN